MFADCKLDKEYKKESKFIQPFPAGTEKVPYVREDSNSNTTEEHRDDCTTENSSNNDEGAKNDIIQVQISQPDEDFKEEKVQSNPYDLPEDF